jgi:F-type H+-transporting ATPase subunit delta
MNIETLAKRYAEALYQIGQESRTLASLVSELGRVNEVYASSSDLRDILNNPLVSESERQAVLDDIGQRLNLGDTIKHTLTLLAERRRVAVLPSLVRTLSKLNDEREGLVRAEVITAVPYPESYFEKLRRKLEETTQKKVVLETKVDPSLIGGIITRVGNSVVDASIHTRLQAMRSRLLQTN